MELPIVTTRWLQENLNNPDLVLLDASMSNIIGREAIIYDTPVYIPGSRSIDLEGGLCNLESTQVHAFPRVEQFAAEMHRLGIDSDSLVVIYDNQGVYSSPRAWWIFRSMGLKNVYVLDGGLPQWMAEGRDLVSTLLATPARVSDMEPVYQSRQVCDAEYLLSRLDSGQLTILDARSEARFSGRVPEPRPGVRSGHIPGSRSLPFAGVLDLHCYKSPETLKNLFAELLDEHYMGQLVFSCGSGITACIILLAAEMAGYDDLVLYDGSWADWGGNNSLPIVPVG